MDPVRAVTAVAFLASALGAYLLAVRAYYRLRSPRPERAWVPTPDGTRIAVYHRRPEVRRYLEPVLLCHGLAANHVNFDFDPPHSLAHAFAAAGFEVFSVDWRGAGASRA
ncbi:MAG: alpha/beta fold hydrolase, partial [Myxococcaceae bacterium]